MFWGTEEDTEDKNIEGHFQGQEVGKEGIFAELWQQPHQ